MSPLVRPAVLAEGARPCPGGRRPAAGHPRRYRRYRRSRSTYRSVPGTVGMNGATSSTRPSP
ncbi:hypothetical protein, partial [Streptomyces sp. CJ_13]|uniref:hypothetical protein n=1 Tax=Streptomyces sp. CJ_13 TaxID=2724943 RepID=UPI001BDD769B